MGDQDLNFFRINAPDLQRLSANLPRIAQRSQQLLRDWLERQARGDFFTIPDPAIITRTFFELNQQLMSDPGRLMEAQMRFWQGYLQIWNSTGQRLWGQPAEPTIRPSGDDKRFKDDDWAEIVLFDFLKQSYLLTAHTLQDTVHGVEGMDPKTRARVTFYTRQFVDALSPTNFALTNPRVLRHTLETGGENLVQGLANLLDDLERGKGQLRIRMTDQEAFRLGENIAATPGKVVFQDELFQLIQYSPTTEQVYKRPLLIVPPWINKFYILDLRPKNSFIKWAVDQGFTVFVISWVNPDARLAEKDFQDYLTGGTLAALEAIEQATGQQEVNAVGYCLGGTLLMSTLAWLAAHGEGRIKSATCFTTMTDFADVGELEVFIDEEQLRGIERHMEEKGYMEGAHMAQAFNMLRANDLIWSFVINNYLMGRDPMAFDLLYWNSDSTRMPRRMHSFYLRNMYQYNRLSTPAGITLAGEAIDLGKIKAPVYFLSTREDHIAPWASTYRGTQLVGGPVRFVLGGSGHIAGVINPATSNKYGYWVNSDLPREPQQWLAGAEHREGSWWHDWFKWIRPKAGRRVAARQPGDGTLQPLEEAPGSYVRVRIDE